MAAVTKAEVAAAPHGKKWHALYPELGTGPVENFFAGARLPYLPLRKT
jgi:hypothetical protein